MSRQRHRTRSGWPEAPLDRVHQLDVDHRLETACVRAVEMTARFGAEAGALHFVQSFPPSTTVAQIEQAFLRRSQALARPSARESEVA